MRRSLILCAGLLVGATAALALSVQPVPFVDLIDDAKAIVLGKVVASRTDKHPVNGRIYTYYTIAVEHDEKAGRDENTGQSKAAEQVTVRMLGGTHEGVTLLVPGQRMLAVGEQVYLFLESDTLNPEHYRIMGMVQGHFQVEENEQTGKTRAVGMAPGLAELDPKSRAAAREKGGIDLSAPVPAQSDLDELRAAVRQQVLRAEHPRYKLEKAKRQADAQKSGLPIRKQ